MPHDDRRLPEGTREVAREAGDPSREWLERCAREDKLFMTDDERALWTILRALPPSCRFVRQHIVGPYIADFACPARRLIVELAGKYHFRGERPVADDRRRADLNAMGYTAAEPAASHPKAGQATSGAPRLQLPPEVTANAWAVDAACSGNPGPMEYQGIDLATGQQVFHYGPVHGTNNIGEFLAIVHALALWDKQGVTDKTLYSDSYNAILWVKKKQCRTKLVRNAQTEQLYQVIQRAEQWLRNHSVKVPILQWDTRRWGDIPADFGRK